MSKHRARFTSLALAIVLMISNSVNVLAAEGVNIAEKEISYPQGDMDGTCEEAVLDNSENAEGSRFQISEKQDDWDGYAQNNTEQNEEVNDNVQNGRADENYLYNKKVGIGKDQAAIILDGKLYTWGNRSNIDGTNEIDLIPQKRANNKVFLNLASQYQLYWHSNFNYYDHDWGAVDKDGAVLVWGNNREGNLGNNNTGKVNLEQNIYLRGLDKVKQVAFSEDIGAAVTEAGELYTWGRNYNYQLGNGSGNSEYTQKKNKIMDHVKFVSLGEYGAAAISSNGALYTWGVYSGHSGSYPTTPKKLLDNIVYVDMTKDGGSAISENGALYRWGNKYLGNGTNQSSSVPVEVMKDVKFVTHSKSQTTGYAEYALQYAAIKTNGELVVWGYNSEGLALGLGGEDEGFGQGAVFEPEPILDNVEYVDMGHNNGIALTSSGDVYTWGLNTDGVLGNGTKENSYKPVKISVNNAVDFDVDSYRLKFIEGDSSDPQEYTKTAIDNTFNTTPPLAEMAGNPYIAITGGIAATVTNALTPGKMISESTCGPSYRALLQELFGQSSFLLDPKLNLIPNEANKSIKDLQAVGKLEGNKAWNELTEEEKNELIDYIVQDNLKTTGVKIDGKKLLDLREKASTLHDAYKAVDYFRNLYKSAVAYGYYKNMSDRKVMILEQMKAHTNDYFFKNEIDRAINAARSSEEEVYYGVLNLTGEITYKSIDICVQKGVDEYMKTLPEYAVYKSICQLLRADDVSKNYYLMNAMAEIELSLRQAYLDLQGEYEDTREYAILIGTATDLLFKSMDKDLTIFEDMSKALSLNPGYLPTLLSDVARKGCKLFGMSNVDDRNIFELIKQAKETNDNNYRIVNTRWINFLSNDYPNQPFYEVYKHYLNRESDEWKKLTYACPVDIEVYDKEGKRVACTQTDEEGRVYSEAEGDITILLDGEKKIVLINHPDQYIIKAIGNDSGKMDVTVQEMDGNNMVRREVFYNDVLLEKGCVYNMGVDKDTMKDGAYALIDGKNAHVPQTYDTIDPDKAPYTVTVDGGEASGSSYIGGEIKAYEGETITIYSKLSQAYEFTGWECSSSIELSDPYAELATFIMPGQNVSIKAKSIRRQTKADNIQIDKIHTILKKGESKQLSATILPEDTIDKTVIWKSCDATVADVNSEGFVSGIEYGETMVYASTKDETIKAYCKITVSENAGGDEPGPTPKPEPDNKDDNEDGIEEGDLPIGAEIPDGIWIGGLKKSYPYTGNAIKPEVRVYYQSKRLTEGVDYILGYKKNKAVGTSASITVKCKGDFKGSKTVTFAIEKNPLTGVSYEENNLTVPKDGKKHNNIKPVLLMDGEKLKISKNDFDYKYLDASGQESDCTETGSYTVRMTAKSTSKGYSGFVDVPFTVTDKTPMSKVAVTASKKSLPYTGEKQIPTFTLKYNKQSLAAGTYTMVELAGDNYTAPGNHTVIFKGNGTDVIGSRRYTYKITGKKVLGNNKLTVASIASSSLDKEGKVPYANGGAKPKVSISYDGIRLKEGRDYTLSYKGNTSAGSNATVTAKGKGKYSGSIPVSYSVSQRSLDSMLLTVSDRAASNKAEDYKKTMILFTDSDYIDQKLKADKDYTAEFTVSSGNAKPAVGETVTVLIKAKEGGNYTGQATATFNIIDKAKDISRAKVKVNNGKAYEYTGKAIEPDASALNITLGGKPVNTSDYEIAAYYNNVKRSSNAVIIIKGKDGLSGMKAVKFKIGVSPLEKFWKGLIGD